MSVLAAMAAIHTLAQAAPPPVQWTRGYLTGGRAAEAHDMQQTSDGGYIVAGYVVKDSPDYGAAIYLVKADSAGNSVWQRTFEGDEARSVEQTADGGFIVAGRKDAAGGGCLYVLKLDSQGVKDWDRTYGGDSSFDYGYGIRQTSDGGYACVGYGDGYDGYYILKLDSAGNLQWRRSIPGWHPPPGVPEFGAIRLAADGGYIVSVEDSTDGGRGPCFHIIKLSSNGNPTWDSKLAVNEVLACSPVAQTRDGGFVAAGCGVSGDGPQNEKDGASLIRTDSLGHFMSSQLYADSGMNCGTSVDTLRDGGFVIVGRAWPHDEPPYFPVGFIVRADSAGRQVWMRTFGDPAYGSEATSVRQTRDGGYVVAGQMSTAVTGNDSLYLMKLSPEAR